ncbi:hypothetical protein KS4_18610 [Poriferisphaera corsica]|uniref:Carbohydrate-binding domain-containing protein n=1 Tax=Poriferisphaera corsica TaxID=2528020 RepID=A0A517YU86_9BACT|nr:carbohydrate-binding family 9-like protein [Poriferisphaera corsica]QDU33803.1 hypothetical protein KS4_18610 [Poriferisphaera corsica]
MKEYRVVKAAGKPGLDGDWSGAVWGGVTAARLEAFHERSSDHQPGVEVKMVYDEAGVYVHFRVVDQYVIAKYCERQSYVCRDSCAEFFVQPINGKGYFNFEVSCGGHILLAYTMKPRKEDVEVSNEWLDQIEIYHSMPERVEEEVKEETVWQVEYFVPWVLFEAYLGGWDGQKPGEGKEVTWRGNFYKCADESSHPHWGMWQDVGEKLDYHQPDKFGQIVFE